MDNRIKAFPFLTAIAIVLVAISMINATQYVIVKHVISAKAVIIDPYICPLARAPSVTPGHNWLINATEAGGLYYITIGRWLPGTTVLFTDAFGIVNNQTKPMNMTCYVSGTAADYTIIVAHVNTAKTTNGSISASFGVAMDANFRELWNKTRTDIGADGRGRGWWNIGHWTEDVGKYVARNATGAKYLFTPSWDTTDYVHRYDSNDAGVTPADASGASASGVKEHTGDAADQLGSNYVWLEIIVGLPDNVALGDLSVTVEFRFKVWQSLGTQ